MKNKELKDWLYKIGITPRGKNEDFIRQLRTSMDNHQPSAPPTAHAMTDCKDDDIKTETTIRPISRRNTRTPVTQMMRRVPLTLPTTEATTDSRAIDPLRQSGVTPNIRRRVRAPLTRETVALGLRLSPGRKVVPRIIIRCTFRVQSISRS